MDQSQSSLRHSNDTDHRLYTWKVSKLHSEKATPHRPHHQKKVTIQHLPSKSSPEFKDISFKQLEPLQVVMKIQMNGEGNHQHTSLQ